MVGSHKLTQILYLRKCLLLLKGRLLDPRIATEFYRLQGVEVALQSGGDHRMTDFESPALPMIMDYLISLPR